LSADHADANIRALGEAGIRGDRGLDGRRLPQSGEQVAAARRRAGDGQ
jgi:hypothetical protein